MSRYFKKLWPFASIETSTELDSKIRGSDFKTFQKKRDDFPIYYEDREGVLRTINAKLELAAETDLKAGSTDGLVFDSEAGQKPKKEKKLIKSLQQALGKLSQEDKGKDITKITEKQLPSFALKALEEYQKINASKEVKVEAFLTNLKEGLEWKLEHLNGPNGRTANLLQVNDTGRNFTRSARFDSEAKLTEVVKAAMSQELELANSKGLSVPTASLTKQAAQAFNLELKNAAVHLHLDMSLYKSDDMKVKHKNYVMDLNAISAMDSQKPGEDKFWNNLSKAHKAVIQTNDNDAIKTESVKLGKLLLTEASQSSFGGGNMALRTGNKIKGSKRQDQLEERMKLLKEQIDRYGDGCDYSPAFKAFVEKPPQDKRANRELNFQKKSQMSGVEQAFLEYYNATKFADKAPSKFDQLLKCPTNLLAGEMGDIAFSQLTNIHDHVSCKSGQDRTLTLTALRCAVKECGWPQDKADTTTEQQPVELNYANKFTVAFMTTVAEQGKAVVEHARGEGGKLKFNIGEGMNEQPIPAAIYQHAEKTEAVMKKLTAIANGLSVLELPAGKMKNMVQDAAEVEYPINMGVGSFDSQNSMINPLLDVLQQDPKLRPILAAVKGESATSIGTESGQSADIAREKPTGHTR